MKGGTAINMFVRGTLRNFLRRLALGSVAHWSLTTLREKLIKIGAKVVRTARYVVFRMAKVAVAAVPVPDDPRSHTQARTGKGGVWMKNVPPNLGRDAWSSGDGLRP